MTKEIKKLKFYHIILISILLSPLLILNSNLKNKQREKERSIKKELNNVFLRKLAFKEDTDLICKKGSDELKEYYKTGDGEKIGIKAGKIESKDEPAHVKALINMVSSEGDTMENAKTYALHVKLILALLAITILSLPGWLVCCFCNCCNCCCCCCCKKIGCKVPFYIITVVIYALVAAICLYGLSQSNSIFVGLADTECSVLRFTGEVLDGETKETKPKWIGIGGIEKLFEDTKTQIGNLDEGVKNNLSSKKTAVSTAKSQFEAAMQTRSNNIYENSHYKNSLTDGDYYLDLVDKFGKFTQSTRVAEPSYSLMSQWLYEYDQTSNTIEQTLNNIYSSYESLFTNKNGVTSSLDAGINSIKDIRTSFDGIKDQISGIILEYSDMIDEYGKLAFKLVFSVLLIIDVAIAAFITLLCFCSFKTCQNCCIRCILKSFLHILWNVLALLTFFTLLFGSIFTLFGTVGNDLISVVEYLLSDKNLNKEGEASLVGDAAKYLRKCVNGDGNIKGELNLNLDSINNLDVLNDAMNTIIAVETTANSLNEKIAFKYYKGEYEKVINYQVDDFKLIKSDKSSSLKLSDCVGQMNSQQNNVIWSCSCTGASSSSNCESLTAYDSVTDTCVELKSCTSNDKIKTLYSSNDDLSNLGNVLNAFVTSVNKAKRATLPGSTTNDEHSINNALTELESLYDDFYDAETGSLTTYKNAITALTNIFIGLTGNGDFSDIINCLFIGRNVKIILKNLGKTIGTSFYNVGISLSIAGISMLVSISFTILLNIIFNQKDEKPGIPGMKQ
jgi:hypothetical protein